MIPPQFAALLPEKPKADFKYDPEDLGMYYFTFYTQGIKKIAGDVEFLSILILLIYPFIEWDKRKFKKKKKVFKYETIREKENIEMNVQRK